MAGGTRASADLRRFMEKRLDVHLNGSRHVVGVLRGYDTFMNIVLDNAIEVLESDQRELGIIVIRGNSIVYWECLDKGQREETKLFIISFILSAPYTISSSYLISSNHKMTTDLNEAEKNFLAFDWSKSAEWQHYFANLYPTPPLSKLPKFKRNFYRRHVDSTLPVDSTVGDPVTYTSAGSSSSTGGSSSHRSYTPKYYPKWSFLTRLLLNFEATLRILYIVFNVLIVTSGLLKLSEIHVRNLLSCVRGFYYLFLFLAILNERGIPKLEVQWFAALIYDENIHYILYGLAFVLTPPRALYSLPQILTCILGLNKIYKYRKQQLPDFFSYKIVKEAFQLIESNIATIYQSRATLESTVIFYLAFSILSDRSNILPLAIYSNFIKFKLVLLRAKASDCNEDKVAKYSRMGLRCILGYWTLNSNIVNVLGYPMVPPVMRTVYYKITQLLCNYFIGRRS